MSVHGQLSWWSVLALLLAHVACSDRTPTGPFVDSTAGTNGGSGGDQNATGGLPGSAGHGGQAGTGGAASSMSTARGTGSGGQASTGGAASSAGTGSGGRTGTAGTASSAGTAGTGGRIGSGGNSAGATGSSAGTGGRAGSGGVSAGSGGTTASSTAVSTSIRFAQDVQPIYMAKCASCHGVTQANVYSWFQGATTGPCAGRGKRVNILVSKITTPICGTKMPEGGSLTTAELNAFTAWAQAGAPNN